MGVGRDGGHGITAFSNITVTVRGFLNFRVSITLDERVASSYTSYDMLRILVTLFFAAYAAVPLAACPCPSTFTARDSVSCCEETPAQPPCCECCCQGEPATEHDSADCPCIKHADPHKPAVQPPKTISDYEHEISVVALSLGDQALRPPAPAARRTLSPFLHSDTHQQRQAHLSTWLC